MQLPVVKNLIATIQRLEHEVGEWRKRCRKAEREKEALQKENTDLKTEKSVADRVMYKKLGLEPRLLGRSIEDSVSVTSVLIPWNSCGITQSTVLGVATLSYLPFCIFNYMCPIMSIIIAAIGYKISTNSRPKDC